MEEANEKRLIIVKQLPEFEEHLHLIKEEAEKRVADAMQMVVSEETVKTVKKVRAELNSEFSALEQSRIAAKKAVMEPYEKLEAIYKTCVTDVYGPANEQLGSKIADVENGLKEAKKEKVKAYFEECALPGFVDSKNEEKTERNAGYLVVSHSGGGMLRQGTRKGIRRTPANRGMRAHRIVKSLDISEDVCHGLCP